MSLLIILTECPPRKAFFIDELVRDLKTIFDNKIMMMTVCYLFKV